MLGLHYVKRCRCINGEVFQLCDLANYFQFKEARQYKVHLQFGKKFANFLLGFHNTWCIYINEKSIQGHYVCHLDIVNNFLIKQIAPKVIPVAIQFNLSSSFFLLHAPPFLDSKVQTVERYDRLHACSLYLNIFIHPSLFSFKI